MKSFAQESGFGPMIFDFLGATRFIPSRICCNPLAGLWFCAHTPLIAVLDSAPRGGFYENRQLSTGNLWITTQKRVFFAMSAYKSPLLDFSPRGWRYSSQELFVKLRCRNHQRG